MAQSDKAQDLAGALPQFDLRTEVGERVPAALAQAQQRQHDVVGTSAWRTG
jgi:hypothetical protein